VGGYKVIWVYGFAGDVGNVNGIVLPARCCMCVVCAGVGKCGKTCGCVCDKGIMTGSQDIPTPTPTHTARCVSYHQ